ncbi:MAG: sulfite exporter TauE/SafE family protein [Bacteroidota bacterium]
MGGENFFLFILFFLVAAFYSSVGFGGGSSYLAILSLFLTEFYEIRTIALLCNVLVVSSNILLFRKENILDLKSASGFVVLSIPLAFLGANFSLKESTFFILLGSSLVLAAIAMFIQIFINKQQIYLKRGKNSKLVNLISGGMAGLLSGTVGIGGGIFLSPYLNLTKWGTSKQIAAISSFFILVNSLSGITGLVISNQFSLDLIFVLPLLIAVFLGGQLGLRISLKSLSIDKVKSLTALLVLYVGIRILLMNIWGVKI